MGKRAHSVSPQALDGYEKQFKALHKDWHYLYKLIEAYMQPNADRAALELDFLRMKGRISCDYPALAEWRSGAIGSGELSHRIHEWDRGPSSALFKEYNDGSPEMSLAYAIVIGILKEDEIPAEVLDMIRNSIAFYRSYQDKDQLNSREGDWWRRSR